MDPIRNAAVSRRQRAPNSGTAVSDVAWLGGGSGPYEPLGLEGKVVSVRRAIPKETVEEPWAYGQQRMFVLEEHREFLVAVVLSHLRPTFCFGPSHEYVTCLDKFDIKTGELVVKEAK